MHHSHLYKESWKYTKMKTFGLIGINVMAHGILNTTVKTIPKVSPGVVATSRVTLRAVGGILISHALRREAGLGVQVASHHRKANLNQNREMPVYLFLVVEFVRTVSFHRQQSQAVDTSVRPERTSRRSMAMRSA